MSVGLIPRNRLKWIPERWRLAHSYCFFLHDECVRALVEYEAAGAHLVTINFESQVSAEEFSRLAKEDLTEALVKTGYPAEARRVVINMIIMGMVSDCLHHIFEALKCFEKRGRCWLQPAAEAAQAESPLPRVDAWQRRCILH